jgi:hypothetical protein
MKALHVEQSLPICFALATLGGILEVAATAVTALPAVREKEGITMKWWVQWLAIAGNVAIQAVGTLMSHLIATWFGPVSLVVPFFYSATLLSNMLIFGLLGERFTKNMRVGTHVIVVAAILLPVVGPDIQEDQDLSRLMDHGYAKLWFGLLLVACAITGTLLALDISKYPMNTRITVLLIARSAAISVNLTVSRAFILGPSESVLVAFVIIKLVSGAIYTYAIVVQSYAVEQARFVPLNATTIIIVNALTGIILWEDWRVVASWYGYICIFVLLGLGCDLLLSVPMLNAENPEFGANRRASLILRRPPSGAHTNKNKETPHYHRNSTISVHAPTSHLQYYYPYDSISKRSNGQDYDSYTSSIHEYLLADGGIGRINAWKELVSPIQHAATASSRPFSPSEDSGSQEEDSKHIHNLEEQEDSVHSGDYHSTPLPTDQKEWTTPQKPPSEESNSMAETTGLLSQPLQGATRLGGRIVGATQTIATTGHELVMGTIPTAARQNLSRLAAWRETVSPIQSESQRRRHNTWIPDIPEAPNDQIPKCNSS